MQRQRVASTSRQSHAESCPAQLPHLYMGSTWRTCWAWPPALRGLCPDLPCAPRMQKSYLRVSFCLVLVSSSPRRAILSCSRGRSRKLCCAHGPTLAPAGVRLVSFSAMVEVMAWNCSEIPVSSSAVHRNFLGPISKTNSETVGDTEVQSSGLLMGHRRQHATKSCRPTCCFPVWP